MTAPSTKPVTDRDLANLQNICMVAATRFDENATYLRELAQIETPPEGSIHPTGASAHALAESFERQSAEAQGYARLFADAGTFDMPLHDDTNGLL